MKIEEIIELEKNNNRSIYLVREGFFYRAYEISAYRFVKYIKKFKVIKKKIRKVDINICFIGFPVEIIEDVLKIVKQSYGLKIIVN